MAAYGYDDHVMSCHAIVSHLVIKFWVYYGLFSMTDFVMDRQVRYNDHHDQQ